MNLKIVTTLNGLMKNKTVRNGGLFSIFSFFNRGVSFLLLMILAKYIGPEEYGELSFFNTLVMFLGYFVGLSTAGYLSVSYFKKPKEEFREDFTAICVITIITSLLFVSAFLGCAQWLSGLVKVSVQFLYVGLLVAFANIFVQLNLDYLRVQEKISWYGVLSCGFAIMNFVLSLYLVVVEDCNWQGRVYAQATCDIIFGVVAVIWFTKDKLYVFHSSWNTYKSILLWGVPLIPHLATVWMKQGVDRYIIDEYHSIEQVGLFSFALNLASIVVMIGIAFNQTNSVNLYQSLSNKNISTIEKQNQLRKKEKGFLALYLAVSVFVALVGVVSIPLVMPKYVNAIPLFSILVVYGFVQCVYFIYCNYLFYFNQTKQLMYITFGTSVMHVLLSWLFTRYSLYCTCVVYVITQSVVTGLVVLKSKKVLENALR